MPCEHETKSFKVCRCANKWRCNCLIPRKRKPPPPFNSGVKLGVMIGLHPELIKPPIDSPPVGLYNAQPSRSKSAPISWKREEKSKEFSTLTGSGFEKRMTQKNLMITGRGPGTHEISQWPENVLNQSWKSIRQDVGFGNVPLFKAARTSTTPGPGYTRKDPYYYIERNRLKGFTCVPTFEYDNLRPRFREIRRNWSLPCNVYNVKHPDSLDTFLNKVTGKRGPYDLFTGPRDESTIRGYAKKAQTEDSGNWPIAMPSEIDRLLHKSNYFKGRWSTCPRFLKNPGMRMMLRDLALCYRDPNDPGPGHYDLKSPRKPKNLSNYPFGSNIEHVRPFPSGEMRPGPGRYKIKDDRIIKGHGWSWTFKSKGPKTDFIVVQSYNSF